MPQVIHGRDALVGLGLACRSSMVTLIIRSPENFFQNMYNNENIKAECYQNKFY